VKFALDEYDAVIVMSHHLVTDRRYLAQLAACGAGYVGVLGPRARRDRLLDELGERGLRLRERLEGPVGLDIGADSPESIALSILADLQQRVSTTRRAARRRTS
jgi:xanthine/CO dehydrogenase XdhC/CoxF family maturation factor